MIRVGIIGGGGFTGQEIIKLLNRHDKCSLVYITSNEYADQPLAEVFPQLIGRNNSDLIFSKHPETVDDIIPIDVAFLATPDAASLRWGAELLEQTTIKVIDLAGAYRIKDAATFQKYYKLEHNQPAALEKAIYGLTEMNRQAIKESQLVANPGCYPTAALMPVFAIKDILNKFEPRLLIDAKSGTSGAGGRKEKDSLGYSTVYENFRAYKIANHQHTPEIAQAASILAGQNISARFTPYLLPLFRGILCTTYLLVKDTADIEKHLGQALEKAATNNVFIRYVSNPDALSIRNVQNTNYVDISFFYDEANKTVLLFSAIDNLMKGAAGSAIQNMNVMCGFDEAEALL